MTVLLSIFWFIRQTKTGLFFLYLWQLKEYCVKRFIDHFRTTKGRQLIFNKLNFIKYLLFFSFLFFAGTRNFFQKEFFNSFASFFWGTILFLYIIESFFVFKNIFQRKIKIPVLTKKIIILILSVVLIEFFFVFLILPRIQNFALLAFWLLFFDIFSIVIFSLLVLFFQIPTVLFRNFYIIKKAREKRAKFKNLLVIGITGSYGKSTTKEFLATILSEKFNVLKTPKNQNSEVGISRCILKELKPQHEIFVVEMGAYRKGGINLLCSIAMPKIGILTGINQQHLALFGSQAKIIETKYELIENLPQKGLAIFNGDNEYCLEMYKKTIIPKRIYFREKPKPEMMIKADIFAENIKVEKEYVSFTVEGFEFKVNVLGKQNISNLLASILVARELGMSFEEIQRGCQKIKKEQGAMNLLEGKHNLILVDSSYSANPNGVISDIDYLNLFKGKKVIVMPCLIELGKKSKEVHKKIGKEIGRVCDLAIITTKERFEEIKEGALESGMKEENIAFVENAEEIFQRIEFFCVPGDVVLLEGRVPKELIKKLIK